MLSHDKTNHWTQKSCCILSPISQLYLQQCKEGVWSLNNERYSIAIVYLSLSNLNNFCNMSERKLWCKLSSSTNQFPEIVNKVQRIRIFHAKSIVSSRWYDDDILIPQFQQFTVQENNITYFQQANPWFYSTRLSMTKLQVILHGIQDIRRWAWDFLWNKISTYLLPCIQTGI